MVKLPFVEKSSKKGKFMIVILGVCRENLGTRGKHDTTSLRIDKN